MPIVMWLFLTPLVSSLILFALPLASQKGLKAFAVLLSLLPLAILTFTAANQSLIGSQAEYAWFPSLSIQFALKIDALSLLFLFLSALIIPISLLSTQSNSLDHPNTFYGLILLLEALLIGFFSARDLVLFAIFWESMLIPLYFIIVQWGGPQRRQAALKFLIYMIAGSVLMVAAVLALYFAEASINSAGSFNLGTLAQISQNAPYAEWLCAIFLLAFAVKTPLFPFHAWLPDAYCQASTPGTIILSALLSKAGIYGFLRIGFEFFPTILRAWSPWLLALAFIGVFYGGLAAWREKDYKRLIAYSSFSHVNFVLAGLFVWDLTAHSGAILQAINHGITIAALFLVAGWLETRLSSTSMSQASGLTKYLPQLSWLTFFFVLSNIALPGTNNFIGELFILFGIFQQSPILAALLGLTIILSVMYMLRWMQKVYFEEPIAYKTSWSDIQKKEMFIALPLITLILWLGIYPQPIIEIVKPAAEKTLATTTSEMPS